MSGTPGKVPANVAQATVKDDETGEVLKFRTTNCMDSAVWQVLSDDASRKQFPEATFVCGQDGICSRRIIFERSRYVGCSAVVSYVTICHPIGPLLSESPSHSILFLHYTVLTF